MTKTLNGQTNGATRDVLEEFPDFQLECRIEELMEERGLKMDELCELTGIRPATLSFMVNDKKSTINIGHLTAIASALRITDIRQLYGFKMSEETRRVFNLERRHQESLGMTEEMEKRIEKNKAILEKEREEREAKKDK